MTVDCAAGLAIPAQPRGNDITSTPQSHVATSPPTKRSYCSSPKLDLARHDKDNIKGSKVVRTRLGDEDRNSDDPNPRSLNPTLGPLQSASTDLRDRLDTFSIPGTPPELALQANELKLSFPTPPTTDQLNVSQKNDSRNSPEYLAGVAERQIREFDALDFSTKLHLTKLCSQHWMSEYNTLKRSIAAAAAGMPIPAPPTPEPMSGNTALVGQADVRPAQPAYVPGATSVFASPPSITARNAGRNSPAESSHPSELIFLKPSTASTATGETRSETSSSTGLTPRTAKVALNPLAALTDAPTTSLPPRPAVTVSSAAVAAVEQVLTNLDQGEQVPVLPKPTSPLPSFAPPLHGTCAQAESAAASKPSPGMFLANGSAVKTSLTHPINISPLIPTDAIPFIADRLFAARSLVELAGTSQGDGAFVVSAHASDELFEIMSEPALAPACASSPIETPTDNPLGNFVLSSCPGKKVRMNGEASKCGRGAICRDVTLDLQRARDEHGVRLVVCCLDDAELQFLGVPWIEYSSAADALGLEVVRMPMLEGFAPESPEQLDADLAHIVRDYTLRGHSVLAHCRGGIGRAGLVASCWMLKMGLVAPTIPTSISMQEAPASAGHLADHLGGGVDAHDGPEPSFALAMHDESYMTLRRVIDLIRRRRNIKAIETPHQVHFLHQYISYLRDHARPIPACDLLANSCDVA
ncbi:hypothetical protein JCM10908_001085 [Rhodotorula pacifica]|uniref:uncharacterized protein n=1 Tax=Rhodotorula pacifica TaxID=1495444 RepID=UPI00317F69D6